MYGALQFVFERMCLFLFRLGVGLGKFGVGRNRSVSFLPSLGVYLVYIIAGQEPVDVLEEETEKRISTIAVELLFTKGIHEPGLGMIVDQAVDQSRISVEALEEDEDILRESVLLEKIRGGGSSPQT